MSPSPRPQCAGPADSTVGWAAGKCLTRQSLWSQAGRGAEPPAAGQSGDQRGVEQRLGVWPSPLSALHSGLSLPQLYP